ncbi:MAG: hypothetical protein A4S17_05700 [Proteobacteria bacterium HN_bin10]|jgi:hypothetical protein|nr:MAG: hypothetical protein A4S17_05700 [Proteobacteria bacterium HN_bin10]
MNAAQLFRLSGAAAIAGGLLRALSAASPPWDQVALEALWTAIDILLTLGLMGIYLVRADKLGFLGLASFAVAIASFSFIGGPDADVFGFSTYEQGAAAVAISMIGLSIAWLRAGLRPLAPPLLWFASVICAGVLNLVPGVPETLGFQAAGALFGLGFAAAGWDLMRR